jgi:acyl-CoA synthetase (AMP-forming)/AMP-acid ligase II
LRVIDYFDKGVDLDPDRPLAIAEGLTLSFRDGYDLSWAIARGLYASGFQLGDGVAVLAPNDPRAFAVMLGLWRAGGAWIPLNARNPTTASGEYVRYTEPRWLFFHPDYAQQANELCDMAPSLERMVSLDELDSFTEVGKYATVPDWSDPFGAPDAVIALMPTGGTTGAAKGVVARNRHWSAMTDLALSQWPRVADPVNLMVAPITHAAGGTATILTTTGTTTVMLDGFDPVRVLESIERHQVTHLFLPPTAYYALLEQAGARAYDTSSLRMLLLSASPVAPEKLARGVEVFGPCVCQCYGQVESPLMVSYLDPDTVARAAAGDHPERLASAGRPPESVIVRTMSDEGRLLGVGERGEIVVRGALVISDYLEMPAATAEAREYGWHHTGDIGYLDEDGFLYIVDRKKDMIVSGGFNVFTAEVEAAILARDEVLECAVIGVPDDKWGEMVTAVVVLRAGQEPDAEEIIGSVKASLGSVQAPKRVEFADSLPKTPAGKVDKKAIRARYWAGRDRMIG